MFAGRPEILLVVQPMVDHGIYLATRLCSGAAMTMVIWDAFTTLDDEVEYIWLPPGRMYVKWLYLFSKWFGMLYQIFIQVWYGIITTSFPASPSQCTAYFIFEGLAVQFLQLCLDAVLILRIRAVYQRRRRLITIVCLGIVAFEVFMTTATQVLSIPVSIVDGACVVIKSPLTTTFLGIGFMVSQTILLLLTYRGKMLMQPIARRSKIISVVVRDGLLVFGVMIAVLFSATLYLLLNRALINAFLPWMPAATGIVTCRMIVNLQKSAEHQPSVVEFSTGPWLPTDVEIPSSIVTTTTEQDK